MAIKGWGITVHGATSIANKYRTAASRNPDWIDEPTEKWCKNAAAMIAVEPYPPAPAGSTYTRTYTLPTGWAVERKRSASYTIVNRVPYAHWVVSKASQAWMHRGRWWTAEEKIKSFRDSGGLKDGIMKSLKDVLK